MKLNKPTAAFIIPDSKPIDEALKRTTHMAIGAHQDDLEIMSYEGIIKCYQKDNKFFTGVVVTNGSGSARDNKYKDYTNDEMIQVRREEQIKAAKIGEFGALVLLDYLSIETKNPKNNEIINELAELIKTSNPEILYTHNLADKHDTHIGVVTKVIKAIRLLDKKDRPKTLLGCEVWRDLDWLYDNDKVIMDVSEDPELAHALVNVFESQIIGGKRYDLATMGRRLANATFSSSHTVDETNAVNYAMDLTPLIENDDLDVIEFISNHIDKFKHDVQNKINKIL